MRFFWFIIASSFVMHSGDAITKKDLPKLPKPVKIAKTINQDNHHPEIGITDTQVFSETPIDANPNIDITTIPKEAQLGIEEQTGQEGLGTNRIQDLNQIEFDQNQQNKIVEPPLKEEPPTQPKQPPQTIPKEKPKICQELPNGLKSHKKEKDPIKDVPSPPPIQLKGLALFGDKKLAESTDLTFTQGVKVFDLQGDINTIKLNQYLYPFYYDKEFNEETVNSLKTAIYDYFDDNRIGIVTITIPSQDITTQILSLVITTSTLEKVVVQGNQYLKTDDIIETLNLIDGQPIILNDVDERLRLFNSNPFQQANIDFNSGSQFGTSDAVVHIGDRFPLRIYAGLDNQGLELLGPARTFYGFNYAYLFDVSDIFSFQYTATFDFNRYQSFTADYIAFFTPNFFFNAYGGYAIDRYDQQGDDLNHGFTSQASLRLIAPWFNQKQYHLDFALGADYKGTNNNLEFIEFDPTFSSTVNLLQFVFSGHFNWDIPQTIGRLNFDLVYSPRNTLGSSSYSNLRLGANPHYFYFRGDLECHINYFQTGYLKVRAQGQASSANLLPSEEFYIGGLESVRGYIESAAVGDLGWFGSLEWVFPSFSVLRPRLDRKGNPIEDDVFISIFYDIGAVYAKDFFQSNSNEQPKSVYLMSIGPAFRYLLSDFVEVDINVGFKLKKTALDPTSEARANVRAMFKF